MKKIVTLVLGLLLSMGSFAQLNYVGQTESTIIWGLLGTDTTISELRAGLSTKGDTVVMSVYERLPDTLPYHPIYYLLNDTCVKQIVITCKKKTWPSGTVNLIVDNTVCYVNVDKNFASTQLPMNKPSILHKDETDDQILTIPVENKSWSVAPPTNQPKALNEIPIPEKPKTTVVRKVKLPYYGD